MDRDPQAMVLRPSLAADAMNVTCRGGGHGDSGTQGGEGGNGTATLRRVTHYRTQAY